MMKINYSLIWSLILCISYTPLINSLLQDSCTIEPLSSRCFWHVTDQPANWTAAQNFCVATGGNLAAVDSGYISYFLDSNSVFYTNNSTWIGLENNSTFGQPPSWQWLSGVRNGTWYNWAPGEPATNLSCATVNPANNYTWRSDNCLSSHAFLCEYQLSALNWTASFSLSAKADVALVYGTYEGVDDKWQHVYTVAISKPQDVTTFCCPTILSPDSASLNTSACHLVTDDNPSALCTGDRRLVNATGLTPAGSNISALFWMADTTATCVTVTNGSFSSFSNNFNFTGSNVFNGDTRNDTITAISSCRQHIGYWSQWTEWSSCDVACVNSNQTRIRQFSAFSNFSLVTIIDYCQVDTRNCSNCSDTSPSTIGMTTAYISTTVDMTTAYTPTTVDMTTAYTPTTVDLTTIDVTTPVTTDALTMTSLTNLITVDIDTPRDTTATDSTTHIPPTVQFPATMTSNIFNTATTPTLITTAKTTAAATYTPPTVSSLTAVTITPMDPQHLATTATDNTTRFSTTSTTLSNSDIYHVTTSSAPIIPPVVDIVPHCPTVTSLVSASIIQSEYFMVVTCQRGHTFDDGTSVRTFVCLYGNITAAWHTPPQGCTNIRCPSSRSLTSISTNSGVHEVTCGSHEQLLQGQGRADVECSNRALWSAEPTCLDSVCGPVAYLTNASLVSLVAFGNGTLEVTMACLPGNRFDNGQKNETHDCPRGASWADTDFGTCTVTRCPAQPPLLLATSNTSSVEYGTHVRLDCLPGYHLLDGNTSYVVTCLDSGQWSDPFIDCLDLSCPKPTNFTNALFFSWGAMKFGDTATFSCDLNFRAADGRDSADVTCSAYSLWQPPFAGCQANRCAPVPTVDFANANTTMVDNGTVVGYTCRDGYQWSGNHTSLTCINRLWIGNLDSCTIVKCQPIESIDHAVVTMTSLTFQSQATINCSQGFLFEKVVKSLLATCGADGVWNVTAADVISNSTWVTLQSWHIQNLTCTRVNCPVLTPGLAATCDTTRRGYGTQVTVTCQIGYWFSPGVYTQQIFCQDNGTWSAPMADCKVVQCQPAPVWQHIAINTTSVSINTTVSYWCADNFEFSDNSQIKVTQCTASGSWESPFQSCRAKDASNVIATTFEASDGSLYGIIFVCAVLAAIACVTFVDLWYGLSQMTRKS